MHRASVMLVKFMLVWLSTSATCLRKCPHSTVIRRRWTSTSMRRAASIKMLGWKISKEKNTLIKRTLTFSSLNLKKNKLTLTSLIKLLLHMILSWFSRVSLERKSGNRSMISWAISILTKLEQLWLSLMKKLMEKELSIIHQNSGDLQMIFMKKRLTCKLKWRCNKGVSSKITPLKALFRMRMDNTWTFLSTALDGVASKRSCLTSRQDKDTFTDLSLMTIITIWRDMSTIYSLTLKDRISNTLIEFLRRKLRCAAKMINVRSNSKISKVTGLTNDS